MLVTFANFFIIILSIYTINESIKTDVETSPYRTLNNVYGLLFFGHENKFII
jgi:hypothetical protein